MFVFVFVLVLVFAFARVRISLPFCSLSVVVLLFSMLGMHGTEEWLPGQPLGNDQDSWSDELIGDLPNIYIYAANNPSESILAKRRGYGTIVSYNVPPYGRSGLYLELANLKDLIEEYREDRMTMKSASSGSEQAIEAIDGDNNSDDDLKAAIWNSVQKSGMYRDVPLYHGGVAVESTDLPDDVSMARGLWMG